MIRALRIGLLTTLGFVASHVLLGTSVFGGEPTTPTESAAALGELDCVGQPAYIETVVAEAGGAATTTSGGSLPAVESDPEEGLADFIDQFEGLESAEFERRAVIDTAAQMTLSLNGRLRATAYLERVGPDWHVADFASCPAEIDSPRDGG